MNPISIKVLPQNADEIIERVVEIENSCKARSFAQVTDEMLLGKAGPVLNAISCFHTSIKAEFEKEELLIKELSEETRDRTRYYLELKNIQKLAKRIKKIYNPELIGQLKNYAFSFQKVVATFDAQSALCLQTKCTKLVVELEELCQKMQEDTKNYQRALWNEPLSQSSQAAVKSENQEQVADCTQQARALLETQIVGYDKKRELICYQGRDYAFLTRKTVAISKKMRASVGSSASREILLFDPDNSPHLQAHYVKLLAALECINRLEKLTTEKMLKYVSTYVRLKIFPTVTDPQVEKRVATLLKSYPKESANSVIDKNGEARLTIPLDYFVAKGLGVCRHLEFVLLYLLDRLTRDPQAPFIPPGRAMQVREVLNRHSKHVWVAFIEPVRRWHIDPMRHLVAEFTTQAEQEALVQHGYSKEVVASQVRKTAHVAALWSSNT